MKARTYTAELGSGFSLLADSFKRTNRKSIIASSSILLFLLLQVSAFAQEAAAGSNPEHVNQVLGNTLLIGGLVIVLSVLLTLMKVNNMITESIKIRLLQEHGIEAIEQVGLEVHKEPWWKRQYNKWTNVVPVERESDIMLDHNYDGIKELDNSLPPWWIAMFYITIAIGAVYIYVNHFSDYGKSSAEQYAMEMEAAEASVKAYIAAQANTVDESNVEMIQDEAALAIGETIFKANCAACHGQAGEGGVGPNLTDEYWLHGGSIGDVFKSIKYGIPEKGMIAWQAQLRPAEIHKISSFIMSIADTNPPNAKEPQGERYQAENMDAASTDKDQSLSMK
ncbi:MAG: cbb3-type cytochrome c oxidase N-terminal domain-containing protein [Bacteroidota bacterium]